MSSQDAERKVPCLCLIIVLKMMFLYVGFVWMFLSNPFVFTNPCNELTWLFLLRYLNTIHDNFPNQTSYDIDFDSLIYSRNFP